MRKAELQRRANVRPKVSLTRYIRYFRHSDQKEIQLC